jgi:3-methyladenine DNA glycosylase Mpg
MMIGGNQLWKIWKIQQESLIEKKKYRSLNYTIIGNELFKKTSENVLLKCLSETEAYLAISNVHSGSCGAHQAGH